MKVKFKKLVENSVLPKQANPGDAGMDLTVTSIKSKSLFKITYGFGLASEFDERYYAKMVSRSSVHKTFMLLSNGQGTIDSCYRGEWMAVFYKIPFLSKPYKIGERAVQIIFRKLPKVSITEVQELSETQRGTGGYGSSGNK